MCNVWPQSLLIGLLEKRVTEVMLQCIVSAKLGTIDNTMSGYRYSPQTLTGNLLIYLFNCLCIQFVSVSGWGGEGVVLEHQISLRLFLSRRFSAVFVGIGHTRTSNTPHVSVPIVSMCKIELIRWTRICNNGQLGIRQPPVSQSSIHKSHRSSNKYILYL